MKQLGFLSWLSKKKLTEEQVANAFVQATFDSVEQGWPEVAGFLNDAPAFVESPALNPDDYGRFLMIVVAGNLQLIPEHFPQGADRNVIQHICSKFGRALDLAPADFTLKVKQYRAFMKQINHPSKNVLTAMTRAVFYKYHLNAYQEPYFRDLNSPNPVLQRELRGLMENFVWDWSALTDSYRIVAEAGADGPSPAAASLDAAVWSTEREAWA